jgi:hypothetical protein
VASATIIEHSLAVGLSYQLTDSLILSLAYAHDFGNSISGPILSAGGAIPGSSVKSEVAADAVLIGAQLRY